MPVLDLQIWSADNQVKFKFYEKPMVSNHVLQRWSALSWNVKKASLAGEVSRRLLNCSPELVNEEYEDEVLDKLRWKMMISGYSEKEREIIVREGKARCSNILKLVEQEQRPLYRPSSWNKEERALSKKIKGKSWYGPKDSVIFVPATPKEILRKRVEKVMADNNFDIKVVEKGGQTVKSLLQRSDISPTLTCWDENCPVCLTNGKGACCVEGVVYRVWCLVCEQNGLNASMFGETGRTAKVRCSEHRSQLQKRKPSSNLWEHVCVQHGGNAEEAQFGYEVINKYPGDPLTRQLQEAFKITNHVGISLNDKEEWVRPAHIRVRGERI